VGVIGLGTGAMAVYAGRGEEWVFYEIDPDIARLARDTRYFTYLQDTPARVEIVLGDGRLSLLEAPDHSFDLIAIDAFSSDAIPTHLLTREAFSVYRSKLSENGVLVLHLSNRYLDLEPIVARLVEAEGMAGLIRENTGRTRELLKSGGDPSVWAVAASDPSSFGILGQVNGWRQLRTKVGVALWTDDFSNIFSVFRRPW
jgi:SAM-dependent methyltransferase